MIITKDKIFYKSLILLAIPIALQNLITFSVTLADSIMIGQLGDNAISGVYMGSQIQTLLQVFTAGIEGAMLILSTQYWGKNDTDSIKKITSIGLKFALIFSVITALVCAFAPSFVISLFTNDYNIIEAGAAYLRIISFSFPLFAVTQSLIASMRSVESAKIGMAVSIASLVTNVSLNYVLIFGKLGFSALGIRGAAVATVIARILELLVILIYVLFIDKRLKFRIRDSLTLDKALLKDFVKYGLPVMAGQLVWAVNTLSSSAIMGRQTAEGVVTALSLANTLNSLAYVVMNGMAGAIGIIIGKTIGEGKMEKIKEYSYTTELLFICIGLLTGGMIQLIKNPFISLYKISVSTIAVAKTLINVLSITIIGTSYQAACLFGLVKSGGDVSFVFKNDCIFVFLVVIPSAIIATALAAPPWVVFLCLKSDQMLKCLVAAVKINRFDWMKKLTR